MGATREANHPNPLFYPDVSPEPLVAGVPTGSPRRHRKPQRYCDNTLGSSSPRIVGISSDTVGWMCIARLSTE